MTEEQLEQLVRIEDLAFDEQVNIRIDLDEPTVLRYMEILDQLPPVLIVQTPEGPVLSDGFHRVEAAARLGRKVVRATVVLGEHSLAVQLGSLANLEHGLPLQEDELETAIWRLHLKPPLGPGWTQREIAKQTGFTQKRVWLLIQHHEQRQHAPVNQLTAGVLARAPKDLQAELARAAVDEKWTAADVRAVVREVERDPNAVRHVMDEARPHLSAMRERLAYVRMLDSALHTLQQLQAVGVTPARIVGLLDDPETHARWTAQLPQAVEYLAETERRLTAGGSLRVLKGGQ